MRSPTLTVLLLLVILGVIAPTGLAFVSGPRISGPAIDWAEYNLSTSFIEAYLLDANLTLAPYSPRECVLVDRSPGTIEFSSSGFNNTNEAVRMLVDIYVYQACANLSKPYEAKIYNIRAKTLGT